MVTDELIKTEFIHTIVSRDINRIYDVQAEVIRSNFPQGTGRLANFLSQHPITFSGEGLKQTLPHAEYSHIFDSLIYAIVNRICFFRRKLALYNRVIWGVSL